MVQLECRFCNQSDEMRLKAHKFWISTDLVLGDWRTALFGQKQPDDEPDANILGRASGPSQEHGQRLALPSWWQLGHTQCFS